MSYTEERYQEAVAERDDLRRGERRPQPEAIAIALADHARITEAARSAANFPMRSAAIAALAEYRAELNAQGKCELCAIGNVAVNRTEDARVSFTTGGYVVYKAGAYCQPCSDDIDADRDLPELDRFDEGEPYDAERAWEWNHGEE